MEENYIIVTLEDTLLSSTTTTTTIIQRSFEWKKVSLPKVIVKGYPVVYDSDTKYLNTVPYKNISMTDCLIMVDPTITSLIAAVSSVISLYIGAKIHANTKPQSTT